MRKFILSLSLVFGLCLGALAQKNLPSQMTDAVRTEMKTALMTKLNVSEGVATKIINTEDEFYAKLKDVDALTNLLTKEKEIKLNKLHTARRAALMAAPLTSRQMEDAIEMTAAVRRPHKL